MAKVVATRRKARSTEHERVSRPARICKAADAAFAEQPFGQGSKRAGSLLYPLAKTDSLGCGVRRDPGHLLHLRTTWKDFEQTLKALAFVDLQVHSCLSSLPLLENGDEAVLFYSALWLFQKEPECVRARGMCSEPVHNLLTGA
ncbi:MAG: hypothetical protein Q4A28_03065 [Brachymonas sp.]|nr:hypothetical protein [Brachymonas sp.]